MLFPPRLRFAPSPNGYLHLGHAYSIFLNAQSAQTLGGTLLLRIEDIDQARCTPALTQALFEDLAWLGFAGWPEPVLHQSQRFAAYAAAAQTLRAQDLLYPCFCSRKTVLQAAQATDPDGAPLYPGTCRALPAREASARVAAGEPAQWRLRMDEASRRAGPLAARFGQDAAFDVVIDAAVDPLAWGDVVLVRKDTPTSYHLSVVVDDAHQAISHIVRGADLLAATAVHRLLQTLLGLPDPAYAHHRLVLGGDSQKLAKSKGSPALRDLRAQGLSPADVRHRLGF